MEHSKVNFKHGGSNRQMPKDPSQVSDKDIRLKKSTLVKANDSEDARKGEVREEHQDRISELHHTFLVTILTFLPFKEAVRTSVLSRRWRHIWTLNPNLNLQVADILGEDVSTIRCLDIRSQVYQDLGKKYVKIVDQILHAYPMLKVDLFRVEFFRVEAFASHLSRWLNHVSASGVETLEITVPDSAFMPRRMLVVPDPFLSRTQRHLKHLHLEWCGLTNIDSLGCFKFLKRLHLEYAIESNEELGRLLSNCVSLEWMRLRMCPYSKLTINSPSTKLKYLNISSYCNFTEIEIYSKSLVTLELQGICVKSLVVDAPSLVEAWFHVIHNGHSSLSGHKFSRLPSFISQLQKLILNFPRLFEDHKLVSALPQALSTIINVKVLVLNISTVDYIDLRWVFSVTKNCPLLQELQLHLLHMDGLTFQKDDDDDDGSYRPIEVGNHTLTQLKVAEISGFLGHQNQIDLAIHLLNHAVVLESLIIHEAAKRYLGEGKLDSWSLFNFNRSLTSSARRLLSDLAHPNVQLVYNSCHE